MRILLSAWLRHAFAQAPHADSLGSGDARPLLFVERAQAPHALAPPGEPLANPRAIELLTIARASHPTHVLDITTNGDFLTEEMADALAKLKPIHISLSLNSANKEERRRSMRSKRPEVAIRAVPLLRDRGIQFTGSIVPSPGAPLDDVADTMRYLDQYGPSRSGCCFRIYEVCRPAAHFETEPFWNALVELAFRMRGELRAPLLIQPGHY